MTRDTRKQLGYITKPPDGQTPAFQGAREMARRRRQRQGAAAPSDAERLQAIGLVAPDAPLCAARHVDRSF